MSGKKTRKARGNYHRNQAVPNGAQGGGRPPGQKGDEGTRPDLISAADLLLAPTSYETTYRDDIVVIVGEPGMGKARLARRIVQEVVRNDGVLFTLRGDQDDIDFQLSFSERVERLTSDERRRMLRRDCLYIEHWPPLDECDLYDDADLIRQVTGTGSRVVITMLPEAIMLLDVLPEARVVRPSALSFSPPRFSTGAVRRAWSMTRGVPHLVQATRVNEKGAQEDMGPRYLEALSAVVAGALRPGLSSAEAQFRLAMVLLGSGTFSDLLSVVEGSKSDDLEDLAAYAPFFGVDAAGLTFACAGVEGLEALRACHRPLSEACEGRSPLVIAASRLLMERGDYTRGALVATLCHNTEDRALLFVEYAVEVGFSFGMGVLQEARDFLKTPEGRSLPQISLVAGVIAALKGRESEVSREKRGLEKRGEAADQRDRRRRAALWSALSLRTFLAGEAPLTRMEAEDPLGRILLGHYYATKELLAGQFEMAYQIAAVRGGKQLPVSLIGALLAVDRVCALVMMGEIPSQEELDSYEHARKTIGDAHVIRLEAYVGGVDALLSFMAGEADLAGMEWAVAHAERVGDLRVQVAFLITEAVYDLANNHLARATVALRRAQVAAAKIEEGPLRLALAVAEALLLFSTEDETGIQDLLATKEIPGGLGRFLSDLLETSAPLKSAEPGGEVEQLWLGEKGARVARTRRQDPAPHFPRNCYWLLAMVASGHSDLSARARLCMSSAWLTLVESTQRRLEAALNGRDRAAQEATRKRVGLVGPRVGVRHASTRAGMERKRVRVKLLGKVQIVVDGTAVNDHELGKRRSKTLLALMVLQKGHIVRRFEATRIIWPETDYPQATQRLYQASSNIRSTVGAKRLGFDPLVTRRNEGRVGLNLTYVDCDLDEFELEAALASESEGDPEEVLDHVCRVRDLYEGDLALEGLESQEWATTRRREVRLVYVDTLVAGTLAALVLGKTYLASSLANEAYALESTREDVVGALIQSLVETDRVSEARDVYADFCSALAAGSGTPPSRSLRELMGGVLLEGHVRQADSGVSVVLSFPDKGVSPMPEVLDAAAHL